MAQVTTPTPFEAIDRAAFWEAVARREPEECWPWTAGHNGQYYGRLRVLGTKFLAHRVAYALTHGPIPPGLNVCHRCDNPPCCNPAHLFVATSGDNIRDAAKKGRMLQKVTPAQVAEMRECFLAGLRVNEIARRFWVSRGCVRNHVRDLPALARRFRWRAA